MPSRSVGVRLRHARKLRGLTQQELAKASGVPQSAISEVETGESKAPSGGNLIAISRALGVSPEWLAEGKGAMEDVGSPLPADAVKVARDWLRLTPEVRVSVAKMIHEMVKNSAAETPAISNEAVERAYGLPPGRPKSKSEK